LAKRRQVDCNDGEAAFQRGKIVAIKKILIGSENPEQSGNGATSNGSVAEREPESQ